MPSGIPKYDEGGETLDQPRQPLRNIRSCRLFGSALRQGSFHAAALPRRACLVLTLAGSVNHSGPSRSAVPQPGSLLYLPPGERHADVFGCTRARCGVIRIDSNWLQQKLVADFEGLYDHVRGGQMPSISRKLPSNVAAWNASEYQGAYASSELGVTWQIGSSGSSLTLKRRAVEEPFRRSRRMSSRGTPDSSLS